MTIDRFQGDYSFLSNFHQAAITVEIPGLGVTVVPDNEHAFQAFKAADPQQADWVLQAPTPAEAKRRGRRVVLREGWDDQKRWVMLRLNVIKFYRHPVLHEALAATAPHDLIEGNYWHDNYWGACRCGRPSCDATPGRNYLGKVLMATRMVLC